MRKLILIFLMWFPCFAGMAQAQAQEPWDDFFKSFDPVGSAPMEGDGMPAAPPPFRTGLVIEWYADSGVTLSGNKFVSWLNTVDTLSARQGTDATRPTLVTGFLNGRNVARFTSPQRMSFTAKTLTNYTVIIVYKATSFSPGGLNYLLAGNNQGIFSSINAITLGYGEFDGTRIRAVTYSGADTNWNIRIFQNTKMYSNLVEATYSNTQNLTGLILEMIGARSDAPDSYCFQGYIAYIGVYNSSISLSDATTQSTYLNYLYQVY